MVYHNFKERQLIRQYLRDKELLAKYDRMVPQEWIQSISELNRLRYYRSKGGPARIIQFNRSSHG